MRAENKTIDREKARSEKRDEAWHEELSQEEAGQERGRERGVHGGGRHTEFRLTMTMMMQRKEGRAQKKYGEPVNNLIDRHQATTQSRERTKQEPRTDEEGKMEERNK